MKYTALIFGLLLIPNASFAAPLTTDQANSLISVVQSSPGIPANVFVPLITSFSNITVPQAESLIGVVQAATGVPANAFVALLISFTQDVIVATAPSPVSEPVLGSTQPVNSPAPAPVPVVVLPVMKELVVHMLEGPVLYEIIAYYTEDGKDIEGVPVTVTIPDGYISSNNNEKKTGDITVNTRRAGGAGENRYGAVFHYRVATEGVKTITVSANGLTVTKSK